MSTEIPFWNYFWHICGLIAILLICLPTGYWIRINQRFAIHRRLSPENVVDMQMDGNEIPVEKVQKLIEAYNEGNFLYKKLRFTPSNPTLNFEVPSHRERYQVYQDSPYVTIVKIKRKKKVIFTIQAQRLYDLLTSS